MTEYRNDSDKKKKKCPGFHAAAGTGPVKRRNVKRRGKKKIGRVQRALKNAANAPKEKKGLTHRVKVKKRRGTAQRYNRKWWLGFFPGAQLYLGPRQTDYGKKGTRILEIRLEE